MRQIGAVALTGRAGGVADHERCGEDEIGKPLVGDALAEDEATEGIAARFTGALEVIGGTNAYARATGIGTMTGTRAAAIGSPVKLVFRLHVRK